MQRLNSGSIDNVKFLIRGKKRQVFEARLTDRLQSGQHSEVIGGLKENAWDS